MVKYCKDWKEDFLQKKTVEGIKEIEEKYAKLIVDNENPEKQTDQFLITKEFSTSTEFSQFIEKNWFWF